MLVHLTVPLPQYPILATNSIVLKLGHQEASDVFFRDLRLVLAAVQYTLDTPALAPLAAHLMVPTNHETGLLLQPGRLAADCRCAGSCTPLIRSILRRLIPHPQVLGPRDIRPVIGLLVTVAAHSVSTQ